jgi:hypothetical protein
MSAMTEYPSVEETGRDFQAAGFSLSVRPIATGRYVACASEVVTGRGSVAVGDTRSVRIGRWLRFTEHRPHYVSSYANV